MRCLLAAGALALAAAALSLADTGKPLPEFDFRRPEIVREWGAPHHIQRLESSPEGLTALIAGDDPYFFGPARPFPDQQPLWMFIRLKSETGGGGQVFYFDNAPSETNSRRFQAPSNEWIEVRLSLPPLGPKHRLRLDPPGREGRFTVAWIRFQARREYVFPRNDWTRPERGRQRMIESGGIELFRGETSPWGYEIRVHGQSFAFGNPRPRLGCLVDGELIWLDLAEGAVAAPAGQGGLAVRVNIRDRGGAEWHYEQILLPQAGGIIEARARVKVSRDREVLFLPMLWLSAGERSFGTNKNQALLPGLEYLENEPGSSEADIIGPQSRRQVPANHKLTFPLMTIQAEGRYLSLIWDEHRRFSAMFDSPDRLFGSGGHAMGILWPNSDGRNRVEGDLMPLFPEILRAGQWLEARIFLASGLGETVGPAIQQYVRLKGLPPLPDTGLSLRDYVHLAGQGWLKSKIREGPHYRHAFWPRFESQPAADAAIYQLWLAGQTTEKTFADDLRQAAEQARAAVKPGQLFSSGVGHIRTPVAPLVFGHLRQAMNSARAVAHNANKRLGEDGLIRYRPAADRPDYGRTYWTNHANGLTGRVLSDFLEAAAFAGDSNLLAAAVARLRQLSVYHHSVPRGAQTWEIPLHTPDILACAHLVNAYVSGYELTGDRHFLEEAVYWAWTGVPFVYLVNPTGQPVGPYGTIAVLGATNWKAPVWFGQPVQWCGLVYADALYRLAEIDREGIWKKLADGITAAGLQHTWPSDDADRVGLLPDYYLLPPQRREGPAINPGTVGINALRLYRQPPLYSFRCLRFFGGLAHAPGEVILGRETEKQTRFLVRGWPKEPYYLLISGLARQPSVKINGRPTILAAPHEYNSQEGWLALQVSGEPDVELAY